MSRQQFLPPQSPHTQSREQQFPSMGFLVPQEKLHKISLHSRVMTAVLCYCWTHPPTCHVLVLQLWVSVMSWHLMCSEVVMFTYLNKKLIVCGICYTVIGIVFWGLIHCGIPSLDVFLFSLFFSLSLSPSFFPLHLCLASIVQLWFAMRDFIVI